jgi:uncharacterized repeat protein (TIGR02543 family)
VDTTGTITGKVEFGVWGTVPDPVKTSLTINNGIFIGDLIVDSRLSNAAETKIIINGGTFDDICCVDFLSDNASISIGKDIVLTSPVIIEIKKTLTLDLNGHSITAGASFSGTESGLFAVLSGGKLTINDSVGNGRISAGSVYAAVVIKGTDSTLVVNGGTLEGYYYGISGNGKAANGGTIIKINDGLIKGLCATNNLGIYHPQAGTLTVNGGKVTGYNSGIAIKSGTLTITGGTIECTGPNTAPTEGFSNGVNASGAAIQIESNNGYAGDIKIEISGSSIINSMNGYALYEYLNTTGSNPAKITKVTGLRIEGGTFTYGKNGFALFSENLAESGVGKNFITGGSFTDATCILYMSNTARITINGDCTLSDNATVPAGAELSIDSNKTLTVASGKTLIVNGTLVGDATGNISCPVSFNSNGGSSVSSTTSSYNGLVTQPTSPTKSGYNFAGWYKESGLINAWDFSTDVVSGGTVLYAKWTVKPTPTPTPTPEKVTKEVDPSTGYETTIIESSVTESGRTTTIDTVSEKSPSGAVTEVTTTIVAPTSSVSDIVVAEAIRQIEKVADGDVVPKINVMVSGQSAEIDLTKESIEAIADAGAEVVITSGSAEVVLDNNVVSKLSDGSGSVSVTVKTVPASQLNPEQRKAAENSSVILSASATVGSTTIHELGGTATVTLSYTLKDGEDPKNMKVTYLKDDGTTEIVDAVYDAENETITVKLDHFSFFAVSFATPVQGGADNTVLYICIAIAAIAIIGLVAYFGYFRTKKA